MTDRPTQNGETGTSPQAAGSESITAQAFPWLLRQKVSVPDRVAGYFHRVGLVKRTMPTRRRLTVLKASGGFGKTTLLAECCRRLRKEGVATAWISLDEHDEPDVLDTYIAFACQVAGLNLMDASDSTSAGGGPAGRIGVVVGEIQALGKPFVLAFDELERLENPASVALLQFLLQRGPPNLHLAMACRRIPDGLNVAGAVLDGRARVVTTDELRFSRSEVARYFDLGLSRGELTAEMDRSAGWPLALRISRSRMEHGVEADTGIVKDFVKNWIESRLFADLGDRDRDFLLDIGLFDWMDAPLLDDVLQRGDSLHRLQSMHVLVGLLEPVGDEGENWRLHPLLREHCAARRFREDPQRFRTIHRRIAAALARRGDPVPAMRHAVRCGDPALAGEILERAGGVRLWIVQGLVQLQAADRYLGEEVISKRPRLALVRCVAMIMSGRVLEARELYREVSASCSDRLVDGQIADAHYFMDDCIVRGAIALYGGEPAGSNWTRTLYIDYERLANLQHLDPLARGYAAYGLCILYHLKAEFDTAIDWLECARQFLAKSEYIAMYGELLHGQVDMVRGRMQDAALRYRSARRIARRSFVLDPVPAACADVLLLELAMECDAHASRADLKRVPIALLKHGAPFSAVATAFAMLIEQNLRAGRIRQALIQADELLDYTQGAGLISLARYVAAIRISVLVMAGRLRDAERAWRLEGLPSKPEDCVNLDVQTWREMDAIACARLRWLTANGRCSEGRKLGREVRRVAAERQLKRTLMRATVLSMALEQHAGESESAMAHLEDFLRMFSETPYAGPLVQERAVCLAVLTTYLERHPDSPYRETVRSLLATMRRAEEDRGLPLSERERAVLKLLEGRRDKQIAAELGLTVHGVRYHLRRLFSKLGVSKRSEALRRARALGLIPGDN